jgi:hypothetical protein
MLPWKAHISRRRAYTSLLIWKYQTLRGKKAGESGNVDLETVNRWKKLPSVLKNLKL